MIWRAALYLIAGGLVGFLLLGEFALLTIVPVARLALLGLAAAGLAGAMLRWRNFELWPFFIVAAMVTPIAIDSRIVVLPRCDSVPQGIACLGGSRDIAAQFQMELLIFGVAIVGLIALVVRETRRIIDAGR